MSRDAPFLRRDASEDDHEDEDADRQEPEQDDRRARRSRNAPALQHADQGHRYGRDDRPGYDWNHNGGHRSEQPGERRQEREDADQEPRRPAEVPQPARRREHRRQFIELNGSDHEGLVFVNRVALVRFVSVVPFVSAQAHRFRPPSAEARCRTRRWDSRHRDDEPFGRTGRVPAIAKSRAILTPAPSRCLDVGQGHPLRVGDTSS